MAGLLLTGAVLALAASLALTTVEMGDEGEPGGAVREAGTVTPGPLTPENAVALSS